MHKHGELSDEEEGMWERWRDFFTTACGASWRSASPEEKQGVDTISGGW